VSISPGTIDIVLIVEDVAAAAADLTASPVTVQETAALFANVIEVIVMDSVSVKKVSAPLAVTPLQTAANVLAPGSSTVVKVSTVILTAAVAVAAAGAAKLTVRVVEVDATLLLSKIAGLANVPQNAGWAKSAKIGSTNKRYFMVALNNHLFSC
jgi:hypothetical protein